jgi:hypothetical protein
VSVAPKEAAVIEDFISSRDGIALSHAFTEIKDSEWADILAERSQKLSVFQDWSFMRRAVDRQKLSPRTGRHRFAYNHVLLHHRGDAFGH